MVRVAAAGRALFVVIEGLDGAGTTTQTFELASLFRSAGIPVETTREPSDSDLGCALRERTRSTGVQNPHVSALGFAFDRMSHLYDDGGIVAKLESGVSVICDRYELSSLAYQAAAGADIDWLVEINRPAISADVTVFLDVPAEVCVARIARRGDSHEAYHEQSFLADVEQRYRDAIARSEKLGTVIQVDGSKSVHAVTSQIFARLSDTFPDLDRSVSVSRS